MADHVKLKTLEVEGKRFDIYVGDYRGGFEAVPEGLPPGHPNTVASEWVYDKLLANLKVAAKKAKTRVSVPFCMMKKAKLVAGTARGLHASQGGVLVTWENGEKEQLDQYERDTYDIPPFEVRAKAEALAAQLIMQRDALAKLEKQLEAELEPYEQRTRVYSRGAKRLTLKERVQAAIADTITKEEIDKDAVALSIVK